MPKNCINCGCPISGEGKNKIFCDACLRKISPFLKFISTSKVPAVKLYEANEAKLRSMGLSDMALAYVSKCCTAYDEKKAAAAPVAAVSVPEPETAPEKDEPLPVAVPDVNEAPTDEAATIIIPAVHVEPVETNEPEPEPEAEPALEDEDDGIVIPPVMPVDGYDDGGDNDDGGDDEYEDDESGDGTKRLTLIIIAAVLTLIIFLVLYIGRYIPGYTPGGKDTDADSGSSTATDGVDITDDTDDITSDTDDITSGTDDESSDTDDESSDSDSDDTTETDDTSDTTAEVCIHEWIEATCTSAPACLLCGEKNGEALGHDYGDATCTSPSTCSRCDDEKGDALGHDADDATCTEASVCDRCGKTVKAALGHNYKDATCTSAQTCSRCGDTKGDALGHDYKSATCTEPEKCSRCGDTKGEALGHTSGGVKCLRCDKYYVTLTSIGTSVTDSEGLIVTVTGITKDTSDTGTVYTVNFTAVNNAIDSVNLGGFKIFYVDDSGNYSGVMTEQYQPVNPGGETFTGSVSFTVPSGMTPVVLEYYPDEYALSGMSVPHADGQGAFFWKV